MILAYKDLVPEVHPNAFVEETALVIGDVVIGRGSSVWFYCVVRGDVNYIVIGERTNIQDMSVVHVTHYTAPTLIGNDTVIGHRVVLHGCRIGDHTLVGMGAVVLDNARIGDQCIIGAGALVPPGMEVPDRTLVMGVPAKPVREVRDSDLKSVDDPLNEYLQLRSDYARRNSINPKT